MATKQTIEWFSKFAVDLKGPVLEIGSLINEGYEQFLPKDIHANNQPEGYIGIDIFPGLGVDFVIDLSKKDELLKLPFQKFKTIHIHYVFEHVPNIFEMANTISELLEEGGVLLFSVPFSWRIHRIPVDMWRFTPQGVDYLFPKVEFVLDKCAVHTRNGSKFYDVRHEFPEFSFGSGLEKQPFYLNYPIKILRKFGLSAELFKQRALMHESNLLMYGIKRNKPAYTIMEEKFI